MQVFLFMYLIVAISGMTSNKPDHYNTSTVPIIKVKETRDNN